MSRNNIQKKLRITEESAALLSQMAELLNMSESTFVSELVRNYAIDCNKLEGVKNYALEEAMLVPTYSKKINSANLADEIAKLRNDVRLIKSIVNDNNEYLYTERDMLNALLVYLKPESETAFASTDSKLSLSNRQNIHSFLDSSIKNYEERIRREQIAAANGM